MSSQSQQGGGLPSQSSSSRPAVRSHWRECQDMSEFALFCGFDEIQTTYMQVEYIFKGLNVQDPNFTVSILNMADNYLSSILSQSRFRGKFQGFPYPITKDNEENAIATYIQLMRIRPVFGMDCEEQYLAFLESRFTSTGERAATSLSRAAIVSAFHQNQRPGRDMVGPIYARICEYYNAFISYKHNAPYTSLVGPSGVGKSFTIQQFARQNNAYVAYVSLDRDESVGYPSPSPIAQVFYTFNNRNEMTNFGESYIAAMATHVELCREMGITPTAFFDMQTRPTFSKFQEDMKIRITSLFRQVMERSIQDPKALDRVRSGGQDTFRYQEHLNPFMSGYKEQARPMFLTAREILSESPERNEYLSATIPPIDTTRPEFILGFDEARGLLEKVGSEEAMRFLSLRRAIRHQSISQAARNNRYFALFLDTTSKVANFTPPKYQDHSLKIVPENTGLLFEPIYRLDGMDVFSLRNNTVIRDPRKLIAATEDEVAQSLFTLGRPLWGAFLEKSDLGLLIDLAFEKVVGANRRQLSVSSSHPRFLAIASYRLNFYVTAPNLADKLTSGHLRFITGINQDRSVIRTSQPSEPILAYVSASLTQFGENRLNVVKSLYKHLVQGSINVGDIGEVVAALILLYNFDRMHELPAGIKPGRRQAPKKVADYVMTLFPEDICADIRLPVDDNKELRNYWHKGYVFVTHFVRLTEKPDENTLRRAFCRGAAIFTPVGYPGCDIIIPVGLSDSSTMSYLLVQVKNRKYDSMTSGLRQEARDSLKMAADYLPDRAHIGMMMALRRKGHSQLLPLSHKKRKSETLRFSIAEPEETERNTRSRTESRWNWSRIPRLVLLSLGADLTTYPGLGFRRGDEADQYDDQIVEVLNALLSCTVDGLPEQSSDLFYRHLLPLDYTQ